MPGRLLDAKKSWAFESRECENTQGRQEVESGLGEESASGKSDPKPEQLSYFRKDVEGDRVGPGEGTRRELSLSRKLGKMGEYGLVGKDPSPYQVTLANA